MARTERAMAAKALRLPAPSGEAAVALAEEGAGAGGGGGDLAEDAVEPWVALARAVGGVRAAAVLPAGSEKLTGMLAAAMRDPSGQDPGKVVPPSPAARVLAPLTTASRGN